MIFEISKKWKIVFFSIFSALLLVGAFLLYKILTYQKPIEGKTIIDCENLGKTAFLILEEKDKRILTSNDGFIKIEIPKDWKVSQSDTEIDFFEPNSEENNPVKNAKAGYCGLGAQLLKCNKLSEFSTQADQTRAEIEFIKSGKIKNEPESKYKEELFLIGDTEGVKYSYVKDEKIMNMRIWLPINDSVYIFDSGIIFNNDCVGKFNEIIKTLQVN